MRAYGWWAALGLTLAAARLCHLEILWPEETLPLAAALQMLDGRILYRDVWFDKPPLLPAAYLLEGARHGWGLRLAGALYVLIACRLMWRLGRRLWGEQEGRWAAALLAFYLTFWIPAAVVPLASDLLMLAPHVAAAWLALEGRGLPAGVAAGVAFQISPKGLVVPAVCLLFARGGRLRVAAGFLLPALAVAGWLISHGAFRDYYHQVWELGTTYARDTFLSNPLQEGLVRTANWAGFHLALLAGSLVFWIRKGERHRGRIALWALVAFCGVLLGWRFFPRYYFLLLPPLAAAAARGIVVMGQRRIVALALMLIPLIRFGPRYVTLAADLAAGRPHAWRDIAMDQDSRAAARFLRDRARAGDTLFVWGYRPELYIYTQLAPATRFLESQPLTGVFADRHLFQSQVSDQELARTGRLELLRSRPVWLLDGLSPLNPRLAMESYPELRPWLANYVFMGRTRMTLVYRRKELTFPATAAYASPKTP